MKKYDLIIVGGGPSGMMAAFAAKNNGVENILLIEKNEKLGKKLYITGKGRCNITNNSDISDFFSMITTNSDFMYSSLYNFTNESLIDFFSKYGLPTKVERGGRVFPKSDKASDVIKALEKSIAGVEVLLNTEVNQLSKPNLFELRTNKGKFSCEKLIISTGGITYPGTGSTGDGYKFAKDFGHEIINPKGSLLPLKLNKKSIAKVSGLTVKNSEINIYRKGKKINSYFGDFLFTHTGISGPIVLSMSDYLTDYKVEEINLRCNLKPAIPNNELDKRLLKDIDDNPKKHLKNILPNYLPKSLVEFLLINSNIDGDIKLSDITKKTRKDIIDLMQDFDLGYIGPMEDSLGIITKGGINTNEIDPSTMESKLVEGLYFCGELINVSALTGGYNLQIAFSTGYNAGKSIQV